MRYLLNTNHIVNCQQMKLTINKLKSEHLMTKKSL